MIAATIIGGLVGLAAALWVSGAYLLARFVTRVRRPTIFDVMALTPYELRIPHEDMHFKADDGWPLFGWWIPCQGAERTIVLCSGYRGNKSEVVGLAPFLRERGFNIFAVDLRGQGASGLAPVTMGWRESLDVQAAVRATHERVPSGSVGVLAYSMGGAACLLAAASGAKVDAIVTDSAFASARGVVLHNVREWAHIRGEALAPLMDWFLQRRLGFRLADVDSSQAAARITCPLLVIHGDADSMVPVAHARAIYEHAPAPKELWLVPGVNHAGAYFAGRDEYIRRVSAFFAAHLGRGRARNM